MVEVEKLTKTVKALKEAQNLISTHQRWTKGELARDNKGVSVGAGSKSKYACRYCSIGALYNVTSRSTHSFFQSMNYLRYTMDGVAKTNDDPETKHKHVMMAFDFAILMAEDDLKAAKKLK